ncbi:MAG: hypothetical protein PUG65_02895 [Firmicutes bacterium]|nr:hypothetical protein [Bacillota bacterium]MDY4559987.1 hypothetical protein [Eubacteriales bacterium]
MKKKIFDKVLSIASMIIGIIFIIVLLITIFGGFNQDVFNNDLVKGLFVALGVVYIFMSVGALFYTFSDSDAVREIVINSDKANNTKLSASVVKKMVRNNVKTVEGVKCQKISLILTEYGVKLKVGIKIVSGNVQEKSVYLKCLIEDVFYKTLNYRFYAIDFKISSLKTEYVGADDSLKDRAKREYEQLALQPQEEPKTEEQSEEVEEQSAQSEE